MNRRDFIGKSAAILAVGAVGQNVFSFPNAVAKPNKGKIGIQLYSVKDDLEKDLTGSLKKLSGIGYSAVETYGFTGEKFVGKTMKELSIILKDMGMTLSGSHTGSGLLPENTDDPAWDFWKKCAAEIRSGGGKWAIQSFFPGAKSLSDLKKLADHFNRCGEVCKKHGVKFGIHNHSAEFRVVEGTVIYDFLLQNTDAKLVNFQLDTGHALESGADCVQYVQTYPGRFTCWHASDYNVQNKAVVELGKGNVDYPELFELARTAKLELLTVEQENGADRFESCRIDFEYMKRFKWTGLAG